MKNFFQIQLTSQQAQKCAPKAMSSQLRLQKKTLTKVVFFIHLIKLPQCEIKDNSSSTSTCN